MRTLSPTPYLSLISLLICTSVLANPRGPLVDMDMNASPCTYPNNSFEGDVRLDRGCIYSQTFKIKTSNTTLDCDGAQLKPDDGSYSLDIRNTIDNVTVMNCYIHGGKGIAIRVRKGIHGEDHDALRAQSPTNVVVQNVSIIDSENTGVYLHKYTVGVTIKDSIIKNTSSAGLYLAPYGRKHRIENNLIERSGHIKPDGLPRLGWYQREGIAIDASSEHIISGNDIIDSALAGITLYKNCWEHRATDPKSHPRTDHARANIIEGNRFANQSFGVWVASRQSRDLAQMECGDPTPYDNPINVNDVLHPAFGEYASAYAELYLLSILGASIWPDFAEENEIRGNTFEDIRRGGIRIEDDLTVVEDNIFIGEFDYVFVGAPFRARLADQPIRGTAIRSNHYISEADDDFESRLALIPDEHIETLLEGNFRGCQLPDSSILRHGQLHPNPAPDEGDMACDPSALRCNNGRLVDNICGSGPAGGLHSQGGSESVSGGGSTGPSAVQPHNGGSIANEPAAGRVKTPENDVVPAEGPIAGANRIPNKMGSEPATGPQPDDGGMSTKESSPNNAAPSGHTGGSCSTLPTTQNSTWVLVLAIGAVVLGRRTLRSIVDRFNRPPTDFQSMSTPRCMAQLSHWHTGQ